MIKRIVELRKHKNLSQEQFASQLGLSRNFINQVETGKKNISDRTIADICRVFNINEMWLRTGKGEKYAPQPTAALELLAVDHNLTNGDYIFIEKFLSLKPEFRRALLDYAREVALAIADMETDGISPDSSAAYPAHSAGIPLTDDEIKKRATMYEELAQDDAYSSIKKAELDPDIEEQVERYRQQLILEASARTSEESTPAKTG